MKVLEEFLEDEKSWKEKYGYGKSWAVEGRYSVFKGLFSENAWSKKDEKVKSEVMLKVNLMNVSTSFVVGAWDKEKLAQIKEKQGRNHEILRKPGRIPVQIIAAPGIRLLKPAWYLLSRLCKKLIQ